MLGYDTTLTMQAVLVELKFNKPPHYIVKRLEKEKQFGKIEKMDGGDVLYTIEVLQPEEMIPWIRSFGEHATVCESNQHNLYQDISQDWRKMKELYEINQ